MKKLCLKNKNQKQNCTRDKPETDYRTTQNKEEIRGENKRFNAVTEASTSVQFQVNK